MQESSGSTLTQTPVEESKERMSEIVTTRRLNRTTLDRQLLLTRSPLHARSAVEHLVGMQAQVPTAPYVGLWSRCASFTTDELAEAISSGEMVRLAVMRGTLHLVTARDALMLRPLAQPIMTRVLTTGSMYGKHLTEIDLDELAEAGRALLEERPRTLADLRVALAERWPDVDPSSLAYGVHYLLPLVQLPPRGVWGKGGRAICTTAEKWIGRPLDARPSIDLMIIRYLGAFGPASIRDMQAWCGLTRLKERFDLLRNDLRVYRDENDVELFDLPDAALVDEEAPAAPRFLPEFDNILYGYHDRTRVIPERHRAHVVRNLGRTTFLIDGFVAGEWSTSCEKSAAVLTIAPFEKLTPEDETAIGEEGERLLRFVREDATSFDVRIVDPIG